MVRIDVAYPGDFRCVVRHASSGATFSTDVPVDHGGQGRGFAATDLVAAALAVCMMSVMAIAARRREIRLEGAEAVVEKEMQIEPERRIGRLAVLFRMPAGIALEERQVLERAALACPVHKSLAREIDVPIRFVYPD